MDGFKAKSLSSFHDGFRETVLEKYHSKIFFVDKPYIYKIVTTLYIKTVLREPLSKVCRKKGVVLVVWGCNRVRNMICYVSEHKGHKSLSKLRYQSRNKINQLDSLWVQYTLLCICIYKSQWHGKYNKENIRYIKAEQKKQYNIRAKLIERKHQPLMHKHI